MLPPAVWVLAYRIQVRHNRRIKTSFNLHFRQAEDQAISIIATLIDKPALRLLRNAEQVWPNRSAK